MAELFSTGIISICLNLVPGTYNDACNHVVDAYTRQMGWRQEVDATEERVNVFVYKTAEKKLGKSIIGAIGAGAYINRVLKERSIAVRLPTLGISDSIRGQVGLDSYRVDFGWHL